MENGTYATNGKFTAEGNLTVPIDYFLSWGYITGIFDVPKDPKEMYIDEDDIDWDGSGGSQGFDDDGDCLRIDWYTQNDGNGNMMWWQEPHYPDSNRNGIPCDVVWVIDPETGEVISINADSSVDEDPVDENYVGEAGHRTFVIATGKIAFVLLLGLFLPLFLSLGLVGMRPREGLCIICFQSQSIGGIHSLSRYWISGGGLRLCSYPVAGYGLDHLCNRARG